MHVLWLIPGFYSFLREELNALVPKVERLSVLTQAQWDEVAGVNVKTIPLDRVNVTRAAARGAEALRAVRGCGVPRRLGDLAKLRRVARHNEVMRELIQRENVDVIHSHFAVPEGTCGWQAACGRPIVATMRGVDILTVPEIGYGFTEDPFYLRNLKRGLAHAAAITVASKQTLTAARKAGAGAEKIHLIPNGVDLNCFVEDASQDERAVRVQYGIGDQRIVLGVGSLAPEKAFDRLIQAFINAKCNDLVLVIAGEGDERSRLNECVRTHHAESAIRFVGRCSRDEIAALYRVCEVFVHPSLSEGFGNVIIEAMASGRPVIATRTGAAADIIEHRINGFLVEPGDIDQLTGAIRHVLTHPAEAQAMAEKGRELVRREMSLEKRAGAYANLYQQVVHTTVA